MCGIVGVASAEPLAESPLLDRMRDKLVHRGPDDAGTWWSADRRVGLACRRLAILDLTSSGHQPMVASNGRACLTWNGEIYNYQELQAQLEGLGHRFRSSGDTEVILAAYQQWGADCVDRLNGMFALALFDLPLQRLLLARDRAGEKPLFYSVRRGGLCFASELKALLEDPDFPREVDGEALNAYLAYGYVARDACLLRDVHKLLPGHAALWDLRSRSLRLWPYWTLPDHKTSPSSPEPLIEELETLLEDSVRLRLHADVPVGIMLSGGIDSSLVTAMAARLSSAPVRTFTISFPGRRDEAPQARRIAKHFGTEHTELVAEPESAGLLEALAEQYDEPLADSSMIPTYLLSRQIRQHAKVALGGDGGDELFAGYVHYDWLARSERARRSIPAVVRRGIGSAASRWLPPGLRGRNFLIAAAGGVAHLISRTNVLFDFPSRRRLLGAGGIAASDAPENARAALCRTGRTPLAQATAVDFQTYLPDDVLVKVDRASMLASLEVRAPWLDHRIVSFAFSRVPDALRAAARRRKILPRLLARRLLPPDVDVERKQGFSIPRRAWFARGLGRFVEGVLADAPGSWFDPRMVQTLLRAQRRGLPHEDRLFALAMLELWRRRYRIAA